MASIKKRKLSKDTSVISLSAVAARKQGGQPNKVSDTHETPIKRNDELGKVDSGDKVDEDGGLAVKNAFSVLQDKHVNRISAPSNLHWNNPLLANSPEPGIKETSHFPRASSKKSSQKSSFLFSTYKPSASTFRLESDGCTLILEPGERLTITGEYDVCVLRGQATLLGAILRSSNVRYRVFAPSSHSIPVLRCPETWNEISEIRLYQIASTIRNLEQLSPLFCRLWAVKSPSDKSQKVRSKGISSRLNKSSLSFKILYNHDDLPRATLLQSIVSAPEWNERLAAYEAQCSKKSSTLIVCGPKSSGKSTFAKMLTNRLLTGTATSASSHDHGPTYERAIGLAFLDIDPGQPEFSTPGQLSLLELRAPVFGPPFTHPDAMSENFRVLREHSIAATTPSEDISHYMNCVTDLLDHYRRFAATSRRCHLVINTPGWILGTGLEVLVALCKISGPTDVIYTSVDGPTDVVERLKGAATSAAFVALPSQPCEFTTRTASNLRTMQMMSYFHSDLTIGSAGTWTAEPLTRQRPWTISYSEESPGFLGVLCLGEQPPASLLSETLNGSLLAVVVVEDIAAFQGWSDNTVAIGSHQQSDITEVEAGHDVRTQRTSLITEGATLQLGTRDEPLVTRSQPDLLPCLNPDLVSHLDPRYSHSIGLILIRGIDVKKQQLQVLTPMSSETIEKINSGRESLVLVSGRYESPGWAYVEEMHKNSFRAGQAREQVAPEESDDSDEDESASSNTDSTDEDMELDVAAKPVAQANWEALPGYVPWVEQLRGNQGRGVGGRVWRVRRDLGRHGDGRD